MMMMMKNASRCSHEPVIGFIPESRRHIHHSQILSL